MEQQPKPKHSKTIIAALIVTVGIVAAVLIYLFKSGILSWQPSQEPRQQQPATTQAPDDY